MALPHYAGPVHRFSYNTFRTFCVLVYLFLVMPLVVIIPLSFNAEPYFTFTEEMLRLDPAGYSLRWYEQVLHSDRWRLAIMNSIVIALGASALATTLGTLAALGLSQPRMPFRTLIMGLLMSPLIVPLIVTGVGAFFFYARLELAQTRLGVVLIHAAIGIPFVVTTVTATLSRLDRSVLLASESLGAGPVRTFFSVTLPIILPGVVAGALFAFVISFDEPVIVLFLAGVEQRTIPVQMWSGIREQISPDILAAASMLIALAVTLLLTIELLRRRTERIRG